MSEPLGDAAAEHGVTCEGEFHGTKPCSP
jgi:hypothetical protein